MVVALARACGNDIIPRSTSVLRYLSICDRCDPEIGPSSDRAAAFVLRSWIQANVTCCWYDSRSFSSRCRFRPLCGFLCPLRGRYHHRSSSWRLAIVATTSAISQTVRDSKCRYSLHVHSLANPARVDTLAPIACLDQSGNR